MTKRIRGALARHGLKTYPDFEYVWLDGEIRFVGAPKDGDLDGVSSGTAIADLTFRIGRLEAANKVPVSVKPDATWQQAVTIMLNNDAPRICASVVVLFPLMAHRQDHNQAGTCNLIERNITSSAKGDDQLASC